MKPVHSTNYSTRVPTRVRDYSSLFLPLNASQLNYASTESREKERKKKKLNQPNLNLRLRGRMRKKHLDATKRNCLPNEIASKTEARISAQAAGNKRSSRIIIRA